MSRIKVLLAEPLSTDAEQRLSAAFEVVRPPAADEEMLCALVGDCDGLIVRTNNRVTRRVLDAGRRLRVVGVAGVGVDNVDLAAAEECGVRVLNTPGASSDSVAEFTVALMLQLLRPIPSLAEEYRRGRYRAARGRPHGDELCGLTVGVVGMGRIGSRVARLCASGIGARVLYNDIIEVGEFPFPVEAASKERIWSECDVITLHVPLTPLTQGMVSADVLHRLRPTALLINTARGAVVDTDALAHALVSQAIGGAALDVTEPEPLPPEHLLFHCPNCILTPHVAARTHRGLARMYAIVDDVIAYLVEGTQSSNGSPTAES